MTQIFLKARLLIFWVLSPHINIIALLHRGGRGRVYFASAEGKALHALMHFCLVQWGERPVMQMQRRPLCQASFEITKPIQSQHVNMPLTIKITLIYWRNYSQKSSITNDRIRVCSQGECDHTTLPLWICIYKCQLYQ